MKFVILNTIIRINTDYSLYYWLYGLELKTSAIWLDFASKSHYCSFNASFFIIS
jgi:hypothetical protein